MQPKEGVAPGSPHSAATVAAIHKLHRSLGTSGFCHWSFSERQMLPLPKSLWLLIHPIALMDTSANSPEPTNDPTPEKKKNKPIMALCMDLGAAEYANSRPVRGGQWLSEGGTAHPPGHGRKHGVTGPRAFRRCHSHKFKKSMAVRSCLFHTWDS